MILVPFKKEHLASLDEHIYERSVKNNLSKERVLALEKNQFSRSIISGDRVLLCGGVTMFWENRGEAWAVLSKNIKHDFIKVHSLVKQYLASIPVRRLEAVVNCDFSEGHRWVRSLGFRLDAKVMQHYGRGGKNCALYARVKEI